LLATGIVTYLTILAYLFVAGIQDKIRAFTQWPLTPGSEPATAGR
jgi:hypothetical protein